MADGPGGDKTERATGKRRTDARKQGQVARSGEVNSTAILLGGTLLTLASVPLLARTLQQLSSLCLSGAGSLRLETPYDGIELVRMLMMRVAMGLAPMILGVFVIAFGSSLAQVGWFFSLDAISFRIDKLNVITGLKRFVSPNALFDLGKNLVKVLLLGVVAWQTVRGLAPRTLDLVGLPVPLAWPLVATMIRTLVLRLLAVLAVLAVLDWIWQKHRYEKSLRMSKQEVKQEHKDAEGDPQIKARLRDIQVRKFLKRMMSAIPGADVVITNPTHYAIALKYERSWPAPKIVAMGKGHVAQRIKELAREHKIPMVENRVLARALYDAGQLDQYVPVSLFQAVAEVLATVYRAGRKAKQMLGG